MKRGGAAAAAAALVLGLLGSATPAAVAATGCEDPAHPIRGYNRLDAAVGVRTSTTVELGVFPSRGCGVTAATAIVTSPSRTYRVALTEQAGDPGAAYETWTGDLVLASRTLRNSDAGSWSVRYEVAGENPESVLDAYGQVVRATRLTFDAGPEPVRGSTTTFTGRLTRADWNRHYYRGISRTITLIKVEEAGGYTTVATLETPQNGRYQTTQPFSGPGDYQAYYAGDPTSGAVYSPVDEVDAT